jgi:hypothetical protein
MSNPGGRHTSGAFSDSFKGWRNRDLTDYSLNKCQYGRHRDGDWLADYAVNLEIHKDLPSETYFLQ